MHVVGSKRSLERLTKHPTASFKELLTLSIPLILASLSSQLLELCDCYFLSRFSIDAWQACCAASHLSSFFQLIPMVMVFVCQAFIGHYKGARQERMIGPFTWQMIYFSIFSLLITYPLSLISLPYLKGIQGQSEAVFYFRFLAAGNFLYPLEITLASFQLGRGKTKPVLLTSLSVQLLNIILDYLLIFGVKGIIPAMGIKGAATATITAQACSCLILFTLFMRKKYIHRYATSIRALDLPLLLQGLKTGFPRALGKSIAMSAYLCGSYFLIHRGGDYQLVFTLGMSFFMFTSFINDGMGQAVLTITSYALGANLKNIFPKIVRTSLTFVMITTLLLTIPLLYKQEFLITLFIKEPLSPSSMKLLKESCFWIWVLCFANGANRIGVSFIMASRDTPFYAFCALTLWVTYCIPVFIGIVHLGWSPAKFFLIDAANASIISIIFFIRFLRNPKRKIASQSIQVTVAA